MEEIFRRPRIFRLTSNVDGSLYDFEFLDGTCVALFSGCDDISDFTFSTVAAATLASQALLDQVRLNGVAPSLAERSPDSPAALVELTDRLMKRDPDERPQHAVELVAALHALLGA